MFQWLMLYQRIFSLLQRNRQLSSDSIYRHVIFFLIQARMIRLIRLKRLWHYVYMKTFITLWFSRSIFHVAIVQNFRQISLTYHSSIRPVSVFHFILFTLIVRQTASSAHCNASYWSTPGYCIPTRRHPKTAMVSPALSTPTIAPSSISLIGNSVQICTKYSTNYKHGKDSHELRFNDHFCRVTDWENHLLKTHCKCLCYYRELK